MGCAETCRISIWNPLPNKRLIQSQDKMDDSQDVYPTCKSLGLSVVGRVWSPTGASFWSWKACEPGAGSGSLAHLHDAKYWVLTYPSGS